MDNISVGSSSSSSFMSNKRFLHSGAECWVTAEKTAQEILSVLKPTVVSDQKRLQIVNYIRELIRDTVGDEVMAFGSTLLKTYLPDGDIDLTVLTLRTDVESLASSVCSILEEQSYGWSPITDVQFVNAQVKVVKCLVQHIRVDISFNQVSGLNALCFLEQMDHYIGRGHLFKCSIILIKAWCFYESRLLGSHCRLMSTYALEVLVLYIINLFHCSLSGPLAVLYKFLEYYSTFDWDKYCISVYGPVDINFLPKVVVETSATRGSNLLLGKNFLESCIKSFSTPKQVFEVFETERQEFPKKHLNIIDPLKGKNNLGRSISQAIEKLHIFFLSPMFESFKEGIIKCMKMILAKRRAIYLGNFYRIKFAFSYGCQKLRDVLELPVESIGDGVMAFFVNTLRSGRGLMLDEEVSAVDCQSRIFCLKGDYSCPVKYLNYAQWYINWHIFRQPNLQILPSLIQSQSIEDECTQNVYFPGDANCFHSSLLVHPNASWPLDSVLSVAEAEKYQGKGTYVPSASSKGKFKLSASAQPFMSSAVREKMKREGTGLFIPKVDIERKPNSKETELCSPVVQCYDWQINLSQKERSSVGLLLKTSMRNQLANVPFESDRVRKSCCFGLPREEFRLLSPCKSSTESDEDGQSSCFDLSLEDFPLHPSIKKPIQAERHNQIQLTKDSPWAGKLSNCGGSSVAVSVMPLSMAEKQQVHASDYEQDDVTAISS